MTTQEKNKEIVIRYNKEFIEQANIQTLYDIVDPEFVNHSAPPDVPKGPEGVLHYFNYFLRPAFPDIRVEIYDLLAEGDKVVAHKTLRATHKGDFLDMAATNKEVAIDVIDIVRLKDGKYIEQWSLMDLDKVLLQIIDQEKVF